MASALAPIVIVLLYQSASLPTLLMLAVLGTLAAKLGGAPALRACLFWGALAMDASALIGQLFGMPLG